MSDETSLTTLFVSATALLGEKSVEKENEKAKLVGPVSIKLKVNRQIKR